MTTSEPVINLLLHSVSKEAIDPDGSAQMHYDPEMLVYRLYNVESDNFPAYIGAHKNVITWANQLRNTTNTVTGKAIADLMVELTANNLISLTGTSAKNGEFMKALLLDKQESYIKMDSAPNGRSIMDTIKANTGQANPMGHQDPNY